MTDAISQSIPAAAALAAGSPGKPAKVDDAAREFEALLIAQMLRTARENDADGDDGDSSSSTMLDVADQQFSKMLSQSGGLGLAKLVVKGLNQGVANANLQQSSDR
jgi:Rod binding domain-containing protein